MSPLFSYAFSLALIAVATACKLLLFTGIAEAIPFLVYYPAVAIAALFGGFRAGLLATTASAAVVGFLWSQPEGGTWLGLSKLSAIGLFSISGIVISYIALLSHRSDKLQSDLAGDREKLALLVEHAPASLAMFDSEMRYLCVSRRWISDYRLENRQLIGVCHYDVFPDMPETWREAHRRGLAGEVVSCEGEQYFRSDGSYWWESWEVRPWCQPDGRVGGIIINTEDITRRKSDENRLKELNQRLMYHMDNSPVAIIEWGSDMRLIRWAGAAERVFGWKAEEVLGKRIEDFRWVYKDDVSQVGDVTGDLTTGSDPTRFSSNRNYRKDGSVIYCEWYNSSLVDDEGKLKSILSLVLDVTDRKRLEEWLQKHTNALEAEVAERTRELLEKNRLLLYQSRFAAMGEMLNTIAHQWRQPLNVLGLHIQNLAYDEELESKEHVETVVGTCMNIVQHMSRTIDDFRDFFKPEKEKVDFPLNVPVERAIELVSSGFRQSRIAIGTSLDSDALVNGYPNEFAQALLCIFQNARDALNDKGVEHGEVTVSSSADGENAVISIRDNAGGIPEEVKERIFDPYFSTKGAQGSGIGLYMTRTIIERMGGTITVSNMGNGAEFRICLPAIPPESAALTFQPA